MKSRSFFRLTVIRGWTLLLWMGVIFFFSSLRGSEYIYEPTLSYYLERKGAHVIEYAILMLLTVRWVFALFPKERIWKVLLVAAVFSITYGVSDELHQFFVPYRGAKISDVGIDTLGVLLMGGIISIAALFRRKKK